METITKVTFKLPTPLVKRLRHYAVDHDLEQQAIVRAALEAYLKGGRT